MVDIIIRLYRISKNLFDGGTVSKENFLSSHLCRDEPNMDLSHWYKFDDTDVSECKMDDDEELRSQCFGGDYSTQTFDQPVMKRFVVVSFFSSSSHPFDFISRQRRWWNAYILFYEKISTDQSTPTENLTNDLAQLQLCMYIESRASLMFVFLSIIDDQSQRMPLSVQRSVRKQNIKFLHNRIHFSPEYFHFMKRIVQSNVQVIVTFFQQQPADKALAINVRPFFAFVLTFLFDI